MAINVAPIDPNEFAALNAMAHQNYASMQQPQAAPSGGGGLFDSLVHGITAAPEWFLNTTIVNPLKENIAAMTGNKTAYQNAVKQSSANLGLGSRGTDLAGALKTLAGNTIGLGTELLAPEAKAGIIPNLVQGAKIGAVAGGGSSLANKGSANDVVKGALEGALGGGALGGASGILGKLTSGVGKAAESRAASTATKQAEAKAVAQEKPFQGIGKAATQHNLQGVLKRFNDLGINPTPENMAAASNLVTGGDNGIVSGTVRQLLATLGNVDTNGVMNDVKAAIAKEAIHLGNVEDRGSAANNALRTIRTTIESVGNKGKGNISGQMDANNVLDTVQQMENRVRELGGSKATGVNGAEARVLKATAASLKSKLAGGGADAMVASHTLAPDDVAQIFKDIQAAGGTPELAQHIVDGINNAQSLQDLRSLQKPFVDASKLSEAANTAAGGRLTKPTSSGTTIGDTAANIATNLALGNHFGIAQNAGRVVSKSGAIDKLFAGAGRLSSTAKSVAARVPAAALPQAERLAGAMAGQKSNTTPAPLAPAGGVPGQSTQADLTSALSAPQAQPSSPFDPANLQSSIATIVAHGGTLDDVGKFLSIASTINQINNAKSTANVGYGRPSAQQYSQAAAGQQSVDQLVQMLSADPSLINKNAIPGQGLPLVGSLESGALGTSQYKALTDNILNSVARINTGANMPAKEEAFYRATYLPQPGDSAQTIQAKLATLQSFFQPILNYPTTGGGNSLTSALGGTQ